MTTSHGGIAGRVAIVLSDEYDNPVPTVLFPGCALMVVTSLNGQPMRLVSLYLPPDARETMLAALARAQPTPDDIPTFWAGDLNLQVSDPRPGEEGAIAVWLDILAARRESMVPLDGPTRAGRDGESKIDMIAAPDTAVGMFSVRKVWRTGLSDHALVYTDPTSHSTKRPSDVLTPWAYKALPRSRIRASDVASAA